MVKTEKVNEGERATMEGISRDSNLSQRVRDNAKRILDSGAYDRTRQVVDDKAAKEIERYVEGNIEAKIRRGELKPKIDSWAKKQMTDKRLRK